MELSASRVLRFGLILGVLLLVGACAPPPAKETQRFFWPLPPNQPRIEYIGFIQSDQDVREGGENALKTAILGRERPQPLFEKPMAVLGRKDSVLVTDAGLGKVLFLDFSGHQIRYLQNKDGKDIPFRLPVDLAEDDQGRIYVADSLQKAIFVFSPEGKELYSFKSGELNRPVGLAVDSARQRLLLVDAERQAVLLFGLEGDFRGSFGKRGSGEGEFNFPLDLDLDPQGNIYVLDSLNARVQIFDPEGHFLRTFGSRGTNPGSFQLAKSIAVSRFGQIYVTDSLAHNFVIFDLQGRYLQTIGGKHWSGSGKVVPGGFYMPEGVDVDAEGSIWIVDGLNRMLHHYQYLTEAYLQAHPIEPGQAYLPPALKNMDRVQ
ncbi:6-bladed beta-propeller [Desulfuromonas carbonis]|uniref:6-bladed beta-propeller n=1 Tax=Desulfuromonas sp. DDH964 TaxID=1823759 RepID=UPI00082A62FE|nr:6-bladed beta-propeller [Desulfuromonas sp. DDH964]